MTESRAVLVGFPSYKDPAFGALPCAEYDVKELERALDSHRDGSPNFEVSSYVKTEDDNWGAGDLLAAVDRELDGCEHFLFYFSGHGVHGQFGLQLATPDREHPLDSGVYFDTLLRRFNDATTTEVTINLDCCYSGAAGDWSGDANGAVRITSTLRDGITILASSGRSEASEGSEDSPSAFTREVIDCLDRTDVSSVDAIDVFTWTKARIVGQTPILRAFNGRYSPLRADSGQTAARLLINA